MFMIFLLYRAYVGTLYVLTHYISQRSLLTPSLQKKDQRKRVRLNNLTNYSVEDLVAGYYATRYNSC